MQTLNISVNFASIMGAIGAIVGGYIIWSAKKLLSNLEETVATLREDMTEKCKSHEDTLLRHERCLVEIISRHEPNHGEKLRCQL